MANYFDIYSIYIKMGVGYKVVSLTIKPSEAGVCHKYFYKAKKHTFYSKYWTSVIFCPYNEGCDLLHITNWLINPLVSILQTYKNFENRVLAVMKQILNCSYIDSSDSFFFGVHSFKNIGPLHKDNQIYCMQMKCIRKFNLTKMNVSGI